MRDSFGSLTAKQPETLTIDSNGTRGLVLNDYLASGLGGVRISSSVPGSLIVSLVEYGRDSRDGGLLYANPGTPMTAAGKVLTGSYNSFLGQSCRARVINTSDSIQAAAVSMTRYDGSVLLDEAAISLPAHGTQEV